MEGLDRLNELTDEMLVNNIMSRLDCTTEEVIRTTATISTRWKNLWTSLPNLIFTDATKVTELADLHRYIWIRYAISRNVEDVNLQFWEVKGEDPFSYDDEVFFKNLCFNWMKLTWCVFNPPNGAISWERLECLCLSWVTLDEDMIEKILSGSPSLESLELKACYGYRRTDITSKSVRKLVFSGYSTPQCSLCDIDPDEEAYIDCVRINAPYISSLTIENGLFLRELVLLNVSSLVKADLDYSIGWSDYSIYGSESRIISEEVFRGLLESLGHVEDITFGDHCLELLSRLEAVDDDREIAVKHEYRIVGIGVLPGLIPLVARGLLNVPFAVALQKCQLQFMRAQNKRLKSTSEILNNMKIIKLQSWLWLLLEQSISSTLFLTSSGTALIQRAPVRDWYSLGVQFQNYLQQVLPSILDGLADENESVREAALGAGHILVEHYAISFLPPLLPAEEDGIFNDNWRIRQSSVKVSVELFIERTSCSKGYWRSSPDGFVY
ncbi:ribonuclease H-like domain-containing protein [Tanacetum coccineum]